MFGKSTIKIVKLFGIEIEIDYSWLIIFLLVTWFLSFRFYPITFPQFTRTIDIFLGIITSFLFFSSVVFHELAHSLVAKRNGLDVKKITLFVFGGVSQISEEPQNAKIEFKMAIAGPLSSIILGLVFLGLFLLGRTVFPAVINAPLAFLAEVNLILAFFNLIPGFPLDGGRVFRAIIWYFSKDFLKSTKIAVWGGRAFAFVLIGLGILRIIFADFTGLWFILIGLFLDQAALAVLIQTKASVILSGIQIDELMDRKPLTVPRDLTVSRLFENYFKPMREHSFLVSENKKEPVGYVKIDSLKSISKDEWDDKKVLDISDKFEDSDLLNTKDNVSSALNKMKGRDIDQLPVLEEGNLVGAIKLETILDYLNQEIAKKK